MKCNNDNVNGKNAVGFKCNHVMFLICKILKRASTQSLKVDCLTTIFLESKYDDSAKSSVSVFRSYMGNDSRRTSHNSIHEDVDNTLHCQEVLVLLIVKILILSMVRNHDLVLLALYMKLHCYFKSNNDTSRFEIECLQTLLKWCSKMDFATMHKSKCRIS